jgi:hypothetical protein
MTIFVPDIAHRLYKMKINGLIYVTRVQAAASVGMGRSGTSLWREVECPI